MASYGEGSTNKVKENKEKSLLYSFMGLFLTIPILTGMLGSIVWFNIFIWSQIF